MGYSDKVNDHFNNQILGSMDRQDPQVGAAVVGASGDVMQLQLKISEDGVIEDAKFKTFGCGSAIASSSLVTTMVKGKRLEEAQTLRNVDIASELELPPQKIHCSVLAEDAIKEAIRNYQEKKAQPVE